MRKNKKFLVLFVVFSMLTGASCISAAAADRDFPIVYSIHP